MNELAIIGLAIAGMAFLAIVMAWALVDLRDKIAETEAYKEEIERLRDSFWRGVDRD